MISKNITRKCKKKKNCLIKTTRNMKIVKKLIILCKFKSYNNNIRKKVSFALTGFHIPQSKVRLG